MHTPSPRVIRWGHSYNYAQIGSTGIYRVPLFSAFWCLCVRHFDVLLDEEVRVYPVLGFEPLLVWLDDYAFDDEP